MTAEVLFIYFMSIVLLWIKPGPGQALKISTALKSGFIPAFSIAVGITIICNFYLLIAIYGSSAITQIFTDIGIYFKLFGAVYLFYLGIKGIKNRNKKIERTQNSKENNLQNLGLGILIALSNPIAIFYFIGILPGLIDMSQLMWNDVVLFAVIMSITGLFIDALLILLTTQFKTNFENERAKEIITIIISLGFILIAFYLLYTAYVGTDFTFEML